MVQLFSMIDKVVEYMVVQPTIVRPIVRILVEGKDGEFTERAMLPEERDQTAIYTDSIELQDRMFLFQYAIGGGDDLESFRAKFSAGLGTLAIK
jgi:hypothetical protein